MTFTNTAPVPMFDTLLTLDDLMEHQSIEAEIWAEGAWLRHAESLGWEEAFMEARLADFGF